MQNFDTLELPVVIKQGLARLNITTPTPVQASAIPPALEGRDILASAQTGTGKTIAFLIPLICRLLNNKNETALVLTPTRELAAQVRDALQKIMGSGTSIHAALIIGGEPMGKQLAALRRGPRVIIGTPGRIIDHMERGTLSLGSTKFLVLDETDRMLDMGFSEPLKQIIGQLGENRQTLMFSATMPSAIVQMSQKYLSNPQQITIGCTTSASTTVKQEMAQVTPGEKFSHLLNELQKREGSVIIFVKTKRGADQLARKLQDENHTAEAIHGNLTQRRRDRVIQVFRSNKCRIMVATDVAARGLDIPHVRHVINYDLPQCPEDYIHRIGRTGRAGAEGEALSLVSPEDRHKWSLIRRLLGGDESAAGMPAGGSRPRSGGYRGDGNKRPSRFGKPQGERRPRGEWQDRRPRPAREAGQSSESSDRRPRGEWQDRRPRAPREAGQSSEGSGERRPRGEWQDRPRGEWQDRRPRAPREAGQSSEAGAERRISERRQPGAEQSFRRGPRPFKPAGQRPGQERPFHGAKRAPVSGNRERQERAAQ
jgi:ATP-dependent RNA helicase DeaD